MEKNRKTDGNKVRKKSVIGFQTGSMYTVQKVFLTFTKRSLRMKNDLQKSFFILKNPPPRAAGECVL